MSAEIVIHPAAQNAADRQRRAEIAVQRITEALAELAALDPRWPYRVSLVLRAQAERNAS
jgi:hypothetical protein